MKINKEQVLENFKKGPSVTYLLIMINIIMYLITAFTSFYYFHGGILNIDTRAIIVLGGMVNLLVKNGEYYRLFTAGFLHASVLHLTLNMIALNAIGSIVEKILGKGKFIIVYILSLIFASYGSYVVANVKLGIGISVGASGAIFGLLGSLLIIVFLNKKVFGKTVLRGITEVIVVNLLIGFFVPNIDITAHVIGGIAGAIITFLIIIIERKKLRKQ
ncbi:rhomboid family intramembrane serine protease [Clostridium senegalense]